MKKYLSLLKASMSYDMNIFKYTNKNMKGYAKNLFPLFLALVVMFSIGTLTYPLAENLSKINLTYIMISLVASSLTLLTAIEAIYKSQNILFDAKDNDLLMSLPIPKSYIISSRLLKLYTFQFLFNLLFIIPTSIIYIYFKKPSISYYISTLLFSTLLPIIPTIIGSFIGLGIKKLSSRFKSQKIIQTIFSIIMLLIIMAMSFGLENITNSIVTNADKVNNIITGIFYPIKLYLNLINKLNAIDIIKLLIINIVPAYLFVLLASKFNLTNANNDSNKISSKKKNGYNYDKSSKLIALTKKEFKKYISTPVYMINTFFSIIMFIGVVLLASFKFDIVINYLTTNGGEQISISDIYEMIPKFFISLIIFTSCLTSITSSSISLEGSRINILKSLPVSTKTILKSKILNSILITIPFLIIGDIIAACSFKFSLIDIISSFLISIILPIFVAVFGLIVNLKYPKMNASSDTEVVKQSASSMISTLSGMVFATIIIAILFTIESKYISLIITFIIAILTLITYRVLIIYGDKRFKEIN